ncbi:MAG: radical SAM protein [Acidobacteria bacterium]|nr:radical SAM protein [Acidobacteriota bacterium]
MLGQAPGAGRQRHVSGGGEARPRRGKGRLRVNEIFFSLQGESTYAGFPCAFIRLTGCDQRCRWCDTEYAFHAGRDLTVDEVLAAVDRFGTRLVEVTGGEPLLQPAVFPLVRRLRGRGYRVLVETGGSRDISGLDPGAVVVLDLKCPASGMSDRVRWENLAHLRRKDQVKFVVADRRDYEWAREVIRTHRLPAGCPVLFSPVHGELPPATLAAWILEDRLPARLQLQLHKLLWGAETRGV